MLNFLKKIRRPFFYILAIFLIGGFGGLIVQKYIYPHLVSYPFFNFLQIDSPLVITKTEQIRVNENVSQRNVIKQLTPKVVTILGGRGEVGKNFEERIQTTGIVVSTDGIIVTDKTFFSDTRNNYYAISADGEVFGIELVATDRKSDLALIKVNSNNFSPVDFGFSSDVEVGSDILVISALEAPDTIHFEPAVISSSYNNIDSTEVFVSSKFNVPFGINITPKTGDGIFNLSGQLIGIAFADQIISSEAVKTALDNYLAKKEIVRVDIGIDYKILNKSIAKLIGNNNQNGVFVSKIQSPSPAFRAGLRSGDIILKINDEVISGNQTLETFLNKGNVGDVWKLLVDRGGVEKLINLTLEELR